MMMRQLGDPAADAIDAGAGGNRLGVQRGDAGFLQIFARQIETADGGVFIDVAQDVGQLQGAAQMMRQIEARPLVHAEDLDGKTPHGAGDPVAVKIEGGEIGRDNIFRHVHVHPVQDGEEILQPQAVMRHRRCQEAHLLGGLAGIKPTQIGAPLLQLFMPLGPRADAIIGDIVHLAAEGIDREHRVAFFLRHQPHGQIEGTADGFLLHRRGAGRAEIFCIGHRVMRLRRISAKAGKRFRNRAATFRLGMMHGLGQRVAFHQQAVEIVGQGLDQIDFQRKPSVFYAA